ncbi:hypothetical protein CPB84DRAFT_1848119 [Gymnopilus junonius]|uniref:Uncharacterized protein n=1 Tax=Gymnopilus junonius TaxID=109634 RepID=A0A9P5NNH2_GYMJU|nr:hypothetical protein CPB84DRAFT_1848119 [Gymnopilus junonius]
MLTYGIRYVGKLCSPAVHILVVLYVAGSRNFKSLSNLTLQTRRAANPPYAITTDVDLALTPPVVTASYECAAPLEVSPSPDVMTRVFVIFQGVQDGKMAEWPMASAHADETSVDWVLEWGGMEVFRGSS